MIPETLLAQADLLLSSLGMPGVQQAFPLDGGANNCVIRLELRDGRSSVLKNYFQQVHDPRDRFKAEQDFYGLRPARTPRVHGWSEPNRLGLFEWIDGHHLEKGQIGGDEVAQALELITDVNRQREGAKPVAPASEAAFSLEEHLELIERRMQRLATLESTTPLDQEAGQFFKTCLDPMWKRIQVHVAAKAGGRMQRVLSPPERILSPSDFGFHNALRQKDGQLVFFDFEYAGWDDPAKLAADFFAQPRRPVPRKWRPGFLNALIPLVSDGDFFRQRAELLEPAYRAKWCAIALNEFIPTAAQRRRFSGQAVDETRKQRQLATARSIYQGLATEYSWAKN